VFADLGPGLQRVPASGGTPSQVTRVNKEAGERFHSYPQFLPGGRQFLYVIRHVEAEKMGIYIGSLDGKPGTPATRIVQTQFKAGYDASSGRLLYVQGAGMLMAQRMELDPPRLTGDPATVAEGVRNNSGNGYAQFSVSQNGTLFYGQGSGGEKVRFGWRDRRASCWKRSASRWRQCSRSAYRRTAAGLRTLLGLALFRPTSGCWSWRAA
jgi:eukaryotic-like serine/threonine-protein kinase